MRRSALCIELHYLANLEFFTRLINSKRVTLEVSDYFMKQTYRNRCYIMGPNGIQVLTVPVHYHKKSIFRDVTIDYHQNWVKDHRKAVQAAYGKAPFFDYFYDLFDQIWVSKPEYLLDLSMSMMTGSKRCFGPEKYNFRQKVYGIKELLSAYILYSKFWQQFCKQFIYYRFVNV